MSKVGICKVDITPPVGIDFVGYHRETGINNVEERIYGTVFVFEKDEMKTVFISIDNIGMLVEDGDYLKNGELYIKHSYEGIELDLKYLEKVLPYLHQLWGRTVHMESIVESKGVVFSYDGKMVHRKYV